MISFGMQSTVHIVFYTQNKNKITKSTENRKILVAGCCHDIVAFRKIGKTKEQSEKTRGWGGGRGES